MLHFESVPDSVGELLRSIAPAPSLDSFALGGGTSLALRFGHRISVDLDFFTLDDFYPETLLLDTGFPGKPMVLGRSTGSLALDCGGIKVEFLRHRYPLLEPVEQVGEIRLLSLADVTAMKLNAIANRGSKKDFFDLVRILDETGLEEALNLFEQKYSNTDRFVAIRSLAWFDDAEGEPEPVSPQGPTWAEVKRCVTAALVELR